MIDSFKISFCTSFDKENLSWNIRQSKRKILNKFVRIKMNKYQTI